jgi:trehalose 6-phosphate phosphatase
MTISQEARELPPPPAGLLRDASLFLDFDGTLVAIAARPDAVAVEHRLHVLLQKLGDRLDGRLAIVSGRAAANIRILLDDPALVIAGSHGAEILRPGGAVIAHKARPLDAVAQALLQGLTARYPQVLVERKPLGLALHYRQAPEAEAECRRVAEQIGAHMGLAAQPGKKVIELRIAGADKGTALNALMREPPLQGGRPVFIGDDETDEAGFRAAALLGGVGVLVGDMRATAAAFRLADVDRTLAWLESAARSTP